MGRPELGRLQPGGIGDATLLRVEAGRFTLTDVDGRTRETDRRIVAVGVVKDGVYTRLRS
jgi:dihydroorotase